MSVLEVFMAFEESGIASFLIDELFCFAFDVLVEALDLLDVESDLCLQLKDAALVVGNGVNPRHQISVIFNNRLSVDAVRGELVVE